jgi:hypothetical protein
VHLVGAIKEEFDEFNIMLKVALLKMTVGVLTTCHTKYT